MGHEASQAPRSSGRPLLERLQRVPERHLKRKPATPRTNANKYVKQLLLIGDVFFKYTKNFPQREGSRRVRHGWVKETWTKRRCDSSSIRYDNTQAHYIVPRGSRYSGCVQCCAVHTQAICTHGIDSDGLYARGSTGEGSVAMGVGPVMEILRQILREMAKTAAG